jgi:hypothetical protein
VFEIIVLIVVVSAIANFARGRGGSPAVWGVIAVVGYLGFIWGLALALGVAGINGSVLPLVAGWGWLGAVALWVRFGLGRGKEKPSGMWNCPNCRMLNQHYAVICEACQTPYAAKPSKT